MDVGDFEKLVALGKEIGLEGKDLQDFLCDEGAAYREKQSQEAEYKRKQLEIDQENRDRLERDRERQDRDRERQRQHELELARLKAETGTSQLGQSNLSMSHTVQFKPAKLPPFDENKDGIDAYLTRFEKYHTVLRTNKDEWALYLATLLKGKALDVYSRLSSQESSDYDALKMALLRRYQLTEEGLKKRFYKSCPEDGESCTQFMVRLTSELHRWTDATKIPKTFDDLCEMLVKEQFLSVCNQDMAMHLREKTHTDYRFSKIC